MSSTNAILENPTGVLVEKKRITSIDLMRGIVMVVMALDHARDFFHLGAFAYNPTDMNTTTTALFFTRWITHFCAPTFVLLAGTSIFINAERKGPSALGSFLITRGVWLVLVDVVIMRFIFFFNFYYDVTIFQVIWVIGASMIAMAAIIRMPFGIVLAMGICLIAGHNLMDTFQVKPGEPMFGLMTILRQGGFMPIGDGRNIFVIYPFLPWLGIMILGYCLGKVYGRGFSAGRRRRFLLQAGWGAILLFLLLRGFNLYGDPAPWSSQKNTVYTVMSFLNTTKYPISLQYALMTLGPVMIGLAWLEHRERGALKPLLVFGRVPLFYYLLHFLILHTASLLFFLQKSGKSLKELDFHFNNSFGGLTPEAGYSLGWAYVAWISVVVLLYPLCRWYERYKRTHDHRWLSYL